MGRFRRQGSTEARALFMNATGRGQRQKALFANLSAGMPDVKSQIPSTKLQISLKFQNPMTETICRPFFKLKEGWNFDQQK